MTTSCVASFPDRTISRIDSFISTEKSFKVTNREVQFVRLTTRLPPLKEMNRDLPPWMDGCPLIIKSQRYFPRQWITPEHWRLYLLGKPIFTGYVGFQEGIWYRDFYGFHSERVEGETIHRHLPPPALIDIKRHTCRDWVVSGTHMAAISCIQTSAMSCCNQPARSKVTGPTGWWWPSSHTIQHKNTGDILKFLKQPMSSEVRPRSKVGRHAVVLGRLALSTQGKGYGNLWLWSLLCQHCHSWLSGGFRVTSAQWCKCPASRLVQAQISYIYLNQVQCSLILVVPKKHWQNTRSSTSCWTLTSPLQG